MIPRSEARGVIKPFHIAVPQAALDDLLDRLGRTRWPSERPSAGWSRGVPLGYLQALAEYWRTTYDWREQELRLNAFPPFITDIDGQTIHFLHVCSPESKALPLILTHNWPGSIVEFMNIIGPLSDPRAHGGDPMDAFHIIAPSIPGFGFSMPACETGWDHRRIAKTWAALMARLGYTRYGAQGGDIGAIVSPALGRIDSNHVVGVHVNGLLSFPTEDPADLTNLTGREQARLAYADYLRREGSGYANLQSTKPLTLAYALTDSPVGQLAWIVEKFKEWTAPVKVLPEDAVDRDQMLTNITLCWLTGTAGSAAQIYYEEYHSGRREAPRERSPVPIGVAVFPSDTSIRHIAERQHNIVHWSEFERGGHVAAMEAPDLLINDMRTFFRQQHPASREVH